MRSPSLPNITGPRSPGSFVRERLFGYLLVLPVALLAGSASALFLWLLDWATLTRSNNSWLVYLLPAAGLLLGLITHWIGRPVEKGNNLILEQIHRPGGGIPRRMAPLILFSTIFTHLFGGSAGREGTAVQMGGSLAASFARLLKLSPEQLKLVLMSGVAAGFGSVFGTPMAGAIFAVEVLTIGRIEWKALPPMLVAAIVADLCCRLWGIQHTVYAIGSSVSGWQPLLWAAMVGIACGLAAQLFTEVSHRLHALFSKIRWTPLRPAIGGLLLLLMVQLLGTDSYLGLGVSSSDPSDVTILSAFQPSGAQPWSWWWKLLFTAITLSSGFKGGEVTPLFFVGATLGNSLAMLAGAPTDLCAALGLVALFAGAANTPLACTVLGLELFGISHWPWFAAACFGSFVFSGQRGIYSAQHISAHKSLAEVNGRRLFKGWRR